MDADDSFSRLPDSRPDVVDYWFIYRDLVAFVESRRSYGIFEETILHVRLCRMLGERGVRAVEPKYLQRLTNGYDL